MTVYISVCLGFSIDRAVLLERQWYDVVQIKVPSLPYLVGAPGGAVAGLPKAGLKEQVFSASVQLTATGHHAYFVNPIVLLTMPACSPRPCRCVYCSDRRGSMCDSLRFESPFARQGALVAKPQSGDALQKYYEAAIEHQA